MSLLAISEAETVQAVCRSSVGSAYLFAAGFFAPRRSVTNTLHAKRTYRAGMSACIQENT